MKFWNEFRLVANEIHCLNIIMENSDSNENQEKRDFIKNFVEKPKKDKKELLSQFWLEWKVETAAKSSGNGEKKAKHLWQHILFGRIKLIWLTQFSNRTD